MDQFKRPILQDHKRAKYHTRMGGPYFQVGITAHQQYELSRLESRVRPSAIVRYASPAFWSRADFDYHDARRQVLANSAFISPSRINTHRKWMFTDRPSGKVVLNPDPEDADGETWEAVIAEMAEVAVQQTLREHIQFLAAAVGDENVKEMPLGEIPWLRRIRQYGEFSEEDITMLVDLSVVSLAAEAADATWVVMLRPNDDWKKLLSDNRLWTWCWFPW
mgnify:CR=1 FL=1